MNILCTRSRHLGIVTHPFSLFASMTYQWRQIPKQRPLEQLERSVALQMSSLDLLDYAWQRRVRHIPCEPK